MLLHHNSSKPGFTINKKHRFFIIYFFILQLLCIYKVHAFEQLSINVEKITSKDWLLTDVGLSLYDIDKQTQQLALSARQLILPKPFSRLKFFDIQCLVFTWQQNKIICQKGKAKINSEYINPSFFSFSFSITDKQSQFTIENLKFAKGTLAFKATEDAGDWAVALQSKKMQLQELRVFLAEADITINDVSSGYINLSIQAKGNRNGLKAVESKAKFNKVSLQTKKGDIATESLSFTIDLEAKLKNGVWLWDKKTNIKQGEFYLAPIYIETNGKAINIQASGLMDEQNDIKIKKVAAIHADVFELNAGGTMKILPDLSFGQGYISATINDLGAFSRFYVLPFFEQTSFDGIQFKGRLKTDIRVDKFALNQVFTEFNEFTVIDNKQRISISNAEGEVNWSINPDFVQASYLRWNKIKIKAIPIDAGHFKFLFKHKNIVLLEPSSIPLLGGILDIKQFNWDRAASDEPKVFFQGGVRGLSLVQLSQALDWTSLSGNISGYIPGVDYENKTLKVNGELKVNVFDGVIKINKLASSGLFTDFSKFYMDMEMNDLDLLEITQKFQVGSIEGRISGFVNNLYLENWQPVTFHAWLGTPENDDSNHRISQKAVENIASIGGGGAADVISKGFLRFFDTFGYDSLGFGCYLYQGVCQLMGVEAAEKGYYIIKGGGLPRIDVIGYNPRVDWDVLMQRLSRIYKSDKIVIE